VRHPHFVCMAPLQTRVMTSIDTAYSAASLLVVGIDDILASAMGSDVPKECDSTGNIRLVVKHNSLVKEVAHLATGVKNRVRAVFVSVSLRRRFARVCRFDTYVSLLEERAFTKIQLPGSLRVPLPVATLLGCFP